MGKLLVWILFLLNVASVKCQKEDYNWITGHTNVTNIIQFTLDTDIIETDTTNVKFYVTNSSVSDTNGQLIFYTNGRKVYDWSNQMVQNGDSLNPGYVFNTLPLGYSSFQGALILRDISDQNLFHLFHIKIDTINLQLHYCMNVLLTDIRLNNGFLTVEQKNKVIIADTLGYGIQACKHGNGRDWWLISAEAFTGCYYILKLDKDSIYLDHKECPDSSWIHQDEVGQEFFSPDGSKFVRGVSWIPNRKSGVEIFDFDRCTGTLSNKREINAQHIIDSAYLQYYAGFLSISPNSKYLYMNLTYMVYQAQLDSINIETTLDTVAVYDSTQLRGMFGISQLAPNGRIYMSGGGNFLKYWKIVQEPDQLGLSCNIIQDDTLPVIPSYGFPNFPNYRLERKVGSECDTLFLSSDEKKLTEHEKQIRVFPNPAKDAVIIDYGNTDWSREGEMRLQIIDELGRAVFEMVLPKYSGYQQIDVSSYATGIYFAQVKRNDVVIGVGKFGKE